MNGVSLLEEKLYAIYTTACVSLWPTASQLAEERTRYLNLLLGTSIAAFIVNFAAAVWAFSLTRVIPQGSREFRVFKAVFYSTALLSPYLAVSSLLPKRFACYLFATLCVIATLFKCFDMLTAKLALAYEKVAYATRWLLSNMIQVPADDAAPADDDDAPAHPPLDVVV